MYFSPWWTLVFFPVLVVTLFYVLLLVPNLVTTSGLVLVDFHYISWFFSLCFYSLDNILPILHPWQQLCIPDPSISHIPQHFYLGVLSHSILIFCFLLSILRFSWNVTGTSSSLQDLTTHGLSLHSRKPRPKQTTSNIYYQRTSNILNFAQENRHLVTCIKESLILSPQKLVWFSIGF